MDIRRLLPVLLLVLAIGGSGALLWNRSHASRSAVTHAWLGDRASRSASRGSGRTLPIDVPTLL